MVSPRARRLALAAAMLAPGACHAIAGVEDKQLDPKYSGSSGAAGSAGADSGTGGGTARPPARPAGPAKPSGTGVTRWFAARRVFLGSVDPTSPPGAPIKNAEAWRGIGHDLDGKCTTAQESISDNSGVCKKAPGASGAALEDGDLCRDNATGRLFAIGLNVLSKDFELDVHSQMTSGKDATFLLELSDLDPGPDDPYVPGSLYVSVPNGDVPIWDGSDEPWIDVMSVSPADPDAGAADGGISDASPADAADGAVAQLPPARFVFPDGYLSGNVWVSDNFNAGPRPMPLFVFDQVTVVDTEAVNLELRLDEAHDKAVASTLSAVVNQSMLDTQFGPIALKIVDCNPLYAEAFMQIYLLPAMDLAKQPPSFVSPASVCDAISLGFGFDWVPIKQPTKVVPAAPAPACDGGV